ncbi:hypothetical protein EOD41_19525 [Mucilaginibacter limnophilus]|uniref:Peptidase S9 prolyl oligopeptidase catalytic domain-containing protein n=1 Tax=Mucilaginibacter limnophilus TaxID=1932778 RepID=A0A437MHR6_9SPHI|nr:PHB depolymerase family esterase [Mucilaginibacter limnophilus]RVT97198.1 hypothetical protein EOD41_19525 [Mucilaginibacter limnophilus]
MKPLYALFLIILSTLLYSCRQGKPVNIVGDLGLCDTEILVRNWELTAPTPLTIDDENISVKDQGDFINDYTGFAALFNKTSSAPDTSGTAKSENFVRYPYHVKGSYLAIDTFFNRALYVKNYSACIIKSDIEQDAGFIVSGDYGLKVWLNGRLIVNKIKQIGIQGYEFVTRVHLKKGENFVMVKSLHNEDKWRFLIKLCSVEYARDNSLNTAYESFIDNYILNPQDTLSLLLASPFVTASKGAQLLITDSKKKVWLNQHLVKGNKWAVALKIPENTYQAQLITDRDTFTQKIFVGDCRKYLAELKTRFAQFSANQQIINNTDILFSRFAYLDTVAVEHDNLYERKLTALIFELTDLYEKVKTGQEAFKDVPGLHIRKQANPEYASESYMVYIPPGYSKNKPLPLVFMMPHKTFLRQFNISIYLADMNRVEFVCKQAKKYNYAVVWSSARFYEQYEHTALVPQTIFEIINEVKKDYSIDDSRMYAYGDCAGGALALFTGNKYPSYFAAIGVDGPAISDVDCSDYACDLTSQKLLSSDFYNTIENYRNFNTLIIHSRYEYKSPFVRSEKLFDAIKKDGGKIELKVLHIEKGKEYAFIDLMPENKMVADIFKFFYNKRKVIPDTVTLATWQLKYNKAFWITIDDIADNKKAFIQAVYNAAKHSVTVNTQNVNSFTIDASQLKNINRTSKIFVSCNGKASSHSVSKNKQVSISIKKDVKRALVKNAYTEGPVNDFYARPFIIVQGTTGDTALQNSFAKVVDTIKTNWNRNFLDDSCFVKRDSDITPTDIAKYNLILVGTPATNKFISGISKQLPLIITPQYIAIAGKKYQADSRYIFIYPNPLNKQKYILVIGGGAIDPFPPGMLENLFFQGWYDYEVWNNFSSVDKGYFNRYWGL